LASSRSRIEAPPVETALDAKLAHRQYSALFSVGKSNKTISCFALSRRLKRGDILFEAIWLVFSLIKISLQGKKTLPVDENISIKNSLDA
jgi:hypothetical protein